MKIESIKSLAIPDIKVIRFARFVDSRGYFTESYSRRDFNPLGLNWNAVQINESYSKEITIRGLHFQWNPYMGKLVRTVYGHLIDVLLDIRLGSPYFGKLIAYDMPSLLDDNYNESIWAPPGFAHGTIFLKDTLIQYVCSGEYSQGCEAGISPLANDIDWSLCDLNLKNTIDDIKLNKDLKITEKDKNAFSLEQWKNNINSEKFIYDNIS
jgi:dTDP-4-dehydrorhamnose 3,5-epimerase